jgi:type I restriction enzyme, S subunit
MDVEPGYVDTVAGALPSDWNVISLADIAPTVASGRTRSYSQFGDYIVYGSTGILGRTNTPDYMGRVILVARVGANAGKLSVVSGRYGVSDNTIIITIEPSLSMDYVWRQLEAQHINTLIFGSGQPLITGTLLKNLKLPFPPTKVEQEAIADLLSDADALIDAMEQLLVKKRNIKQGAMQELLTGKKRLPGFDAIPGHRQTEVGPIPLDWTVKSLGQLGEALIGLTYNPADIRPDGILVLRASNVYEGSLRFDDNVFVDTDVRDEIMVRPGDILICVRNGSRDLIGKCAKIDETAHGMTFGAFMAVLRTLSHDFVFHQFQSQLIKKQIHEHLGATINQITNKSLNSFLIPIPPTEVEQKAIATVLTDMDTEISALETKLAKSRYLKQGMMQELLTGRVRLV